MKIKSMGFSGSDNQEAIDKLSGAVLGHKWEPKEDLMGITLWFNISKQRKAKRQDPDLSLSDIEQLKSAKHMMRTLLGICNGIFYPIGIASPYSIKLKILMKETLNIDNLGNWDSPVSKDLMDEWASTVSEALSEESLQFIKTNCPPNGAKLPCLIAFFDGSTQAFCAVL